MEQSRNYQKPDILNFEPQRKKQCRSKHKFTKIVWWNVVVSPNAGRKETDFLVAVENITTTCTKCKLTTTEEGRAIPPSKEDVLHFGKSKNMPIRPSVLRHAAEQTDGGKSGQKGTLNHGWSKQYLKNITGFTAQYVFAYLMSKLDPVTGEHGEVELADLLFEKTPDPDIGLTLADVETFVGIVMKGKPILEETDALAHVVEYWGVRFRKGEQAFVAYDSPFHLFFSEWLCEDPDNIYPPDAKGDEREKIEPSIEGMARPKKSTTKGKAPKPQKKLKGDALVLREIYDELFPDCTVDETLKHGSIFETLLVPPIVTDWEEDPNPEVHVTKTLARHKGDKHGYKKRVLLVNLTGNSLAAVVKFPTKFEREHITVIIGPPRRFHDSEGDGEDEEDPG